MQVDERCNLLAHSLAVTEEQQLTSLKPSNPLASLPPRAAEMAALSQEERSMKIWRRVSPGAQTGRRSLVSRPSALPIVSCGCG